MAEPTFSICVYCGSRPGENPAFAQAAQEVGRWIGEHSGQLVYGGGRSGLMGTVAEATRLAGGRVVGVIPQALVDKELANRACDELHIVQNMHERKAMMAERSDAFVALPGGIGTFEELFEVWTWRQLGYHGKPLPETPGIHCEKFSRWCEFFLSGAYGKANERDQNPYDRD